MIGIEKNEQLMTVRITDEHLRAIGRVTVHFSVLEMRIRYLVWRLMNCKPESVARLVTAELGFRQLVQLFSSLYKLRTKDKDELKKLKTLLKQIDGASKKRNEVIHSFWVEGLTVENAKRFILEAKKKERVLSGFQYN